MFRLSLDGRVHLLYHCSKYMRKFVSSAQNLRSGSFGATVERSGEKGKILIYCKNVMRNNFVTIIFIEAMLKPVNKISTKMFLNQDNTISILEVRIQRVY